jgi:gas vesicle protein
MPERGTDLEHGDMNGAQESGRGGFVALAVIAAAMGAGAALLFSPDQGASTRRLVVRGLRNLRGEGARTVAQLQREIRRRRSQSRRDKQLIGIAGILVGAGIAAMLTPESGPATRQRLGSALGRIRVGAVDRIERLRRSSEQTGSPSQPVQSVQELGRDPNTVF